jgi:hypothetical protein
MGDENFIMLASVLESNDTMSYLNISKNNLTDQGGMVLANLIRNN